MVMMGFALFISVIRFITVVLIFTSIFILGLNDLCFCLALILVSIIYSTFVILVFFMCSWRWFSIISVDLIRCFCFCTILIVRLMGCHLLEELITEGSSSLLGLASSGASYPLILSCFVKSRMLTLLMLIEQANLFFSTVLNLQCCSHLEYFWKY